MKVKVAPSLMCMDLLNIEKEIKMLEDRSDYFHVDILDWHYCKNMSLAPCFMEQIRKITDVPMDAHLYVDNIEEDLVQLCIDSGAEIIEMPPEIIERQVYRLASLIHSQGKKFGVFINPAVSLDVIRPYAHLLDRLLIMTVDPGFAGQPFVEYSLKKIRQACEWRKAEGYTYEIACDGCCNEAWYGALYSAGCDVFIVGNSGLFNKDRKDTAHALTVCLDNIECAIRKVDSKADE